MTGVGFVALVAGCTLLAFLPTGLGVPGYLVPIGISTVGYALFQTANNTAVMMDIAPDQRGVVSGMLNLSRNLGLITGASAMGAVFAFAAGMSDVTKATPESVATGMRTTFAVAALVIGLALAGALASHVRVRLQPALEEQGP